MPHFLLTPPRLSCCSAPPPPLPALNPPQWGVSHWASTHSISTWHSHPLSALALARVRPAGPALAGPAGACPGFRFFVCGVLGNFRRTRLVLSRSIHLRFCSGHAPPSARPKYRSSPLSHLGRSPPAARPAGRLVPGPVFKYLLD